MKKRTLVALVFIVLTSILVGIYYFFYSSPPIPKETGYQISPYNLQDYLSYARAYRAYKRGNIIYNQKEEDSSDFFEKLAAPSPDAPYNVKYRNEQELKEYFEEFNIMFKNRECSPIKEKKRFIMTLGELELSFKKGVPTTIKGLKISRGTGDAIIQQILVFDKALSNICMLLSKVDLKNEKQFPIAIRLIASQEEIIEKYTKYKIAFNNQDEKGVEELVKQKQEEVDKLSKGEGLLINAE